MSKRGSVRQNMELKKILIIIIFISFTSILNAESIKPAKNLTPYDVVKIQLNALKNNNNPIEDSGIEQVWLFAHPDNKKVTGPYERFKVMIHGEQYKILLNHSSHKIELIMNNSNVQDVLIMPAVNLSDVPKPENEQAFTMIVAGTDSNGNIVENAVVDFTIPCPANCPDNYPNV